MAFRLPFSEESLHLQVSGSTPVGSSRALLPRQASRLNYSPSPLLEASALAFSISPTVLRDLPPSITGG
ncbi:hypothetical protein CRYUN_Cryun10bG0076900 [Craigia yunnanensis]